MKVAHKSISLVTFLVPFSEGNESMPGYVRSRSSSSAKKVQIKRS